MRAGAAKAGVKVRVRQPSTWTVVGAPRSRMPASAIDLEPVANRKRIGAVTHEEMLEVALAEARAGFEEGGIPIGGALFDASGALLGRGHNQRVQRGDPSAHGETEAFRNAGRLRSYRDTTMATTWPRAGTARA